MELSRAKQIQLEDKKLFNRYFENYPPEISEFSFTNLYMWRNFYNLLFFEYDNHLILFSNDYLGTRRKPIVENPTQYKYFFPPIGPNPDDIIIDLFKSIKNLEVHRVPEEICTNLKQRKLFSKLNLSTLKISNTMKDLLEGENLVRADIFKKQSG